MTKCDLSIEARVLIGGFWGFGDKTTVSFDRPHIIHPRARKGLDDLVNAGFLTCEEFNDMSAKLVWTPTDKMKDKPKVSAAFMKANSFPITTE